MSNIISWRRVGLTFVVVLAIVATYFASAAPRANAEPVDVPSLASVSVDAGDSDRANPFIGAGFCQQDGTKAIPTNAGLNTAKFYLNGEFVGWVYGQTTTWLISKANQYKYFGSDGRAPAKLTVNGAVLTSRVVYGC